MNELPKLAKVSDLSESKRLVKKIKDANERQLALMES